HLKPIPILPPRLFSHCSEHPIRSRSHFQSIRPKADHVTTVSGLRPLHLDQAGHPARSAGAVASRPARPGTPHQPRAGEKNIYMHNLPEQYFGDIPADEMRVIIDGMEASVPEPHLSAFELGLNASDRN